MFSILDTLFLKANKTSCWLNVFKEKNIFLNCVTENSFAEPLRYKLFIGTYFYAEYLK